jgi:hypothetical protein
VQEHRYTLPQIGDMLAGQELTFLGLELSQSSDRLRFDAEYPGQSDTIDAWHRFETEHPDLFGDTYRIWAQKQR